MRARKILVFSIVTGLATAVLPGLAYAYVGPGAGISVIGALWGLIVGVVLAVAMVLFWPIRMALRKLKRKNITAEQPPVCEAPAAGNGANPSQPPST